jgi:hypothetical protein
MWTLDSILGRPRALAISAILEKSWLSGEPQAVPNTLLRWSPVPGPGTHRSELYDHSRMAALLLLGIVYSMQVRRLARLNQS